MLNLIKNFLKDKATEKVTEIAQEHVTAKVKFFMFIAKLYAYLGIGIAALFLFILILIVGKGIYFLFV